jgi:DNA-binding MarR family transcriptional regulator
MPTTRRTPPAVLQFHVLGALRSAGALELEAIVNAIDDADGDIRTAARELYTAELVTTRSTPHGTFGVLWELTAAGREFMATMAARGR